MNGEDDDAVKVLTPEQCWEVLRAEEFGRLAFSLVDEIHITPINYAVDDDVLLFRTAEGSKLLGVVMGSPVAFEVDQYDDEWARSIVIRGRTRLLDEEQEPDGLELRGQLITEQDQIIRAYPVTAQVADDAANATVP